MKYLLLLFIGFSSFLQAQNPKTLFVYVECKEATNTNSGFCPLTFLQEELPFLEFTLLPQDANIHVLMTQDAQNAQNAQQNVQMDFLGQGAYGNLSNLQSFVIWPNTSAYEHNELYLKHFKLGLFPYLLAAGYQDALNLTVDLAKIERPIRNEKGYWRYNVELGGGYNGNDDEYPFDLNGGGISSSQKTRRLALNTDFEADRYTQNSKLGFSVFVNNVISSRKTDSASLRTTSQYNPNTGNFEIIARDTLYQTSKEITRNTEFRNQIYKTKNFNPYWASLVSFSANNVIQNGTQNVFSRVFVKSRYLLNTGIEYNLLGDKESSRRFAAISYVLGTQLQRFDTLSVDGAYGDIRLKNDIRFSYSILNRKSDTYASIQIGNEVNKSKNLTVLSYIGHSLFINSNLRFSTGVSANYSYQGKYVRPLSINPNSYLIYVTQKWFNISPSFSFQYIFGNTKSNIINRRWQSISSASNLFPYYF